MTQVKKDPITLERIEQIHPKLREELRSIYDEICTALSGKAMCRFPYVYRTFKEQDELYTQGRTKPGKIVTRAKAGQSPHNYRLAVDIVLLKDTDGNGSFETASWETNVDFDGDGQADWMEVVDIFKRYGWAWGGDWKFTDKPHFEKLMGRSIAGLQKMYAARTFLPGTEYLAL